MKRHIHIWDLPVNKVYVNLKKGFREEFFNKAKEKFGSWSKLGNYFNIKRGDTTIACNWRKGTNCFPLKIALKVCDLLNLPKEYLEKNISVIRSKTNIKKRGGNSGKPIINPKLPIKINEDFIEILGHICGDGTIPTKNIKKGIKFAYINSEPKLIECFKKFMKNVFGEIEPTIITRDDKNHYTRPNYVLQYPTIISLFILSIFDYKTGNNMVLPKFINQMNKKEICVFLRALFDDEGSVHAKRIVISIKPKKVIKDIKNLLNKIGIKTGNICCNCKSMNVLEIARSNSIKKYNELIGFKHPKKVERLKNILKIGWKFERYDNGVANLKIINLLKKNNQLSIKNLSSYLKRTECNVREHVKNLNRIGIVKSRTIKQNNYPRRYNEWFLVGDNIE